MHLETHYYLPIPITTVQLPETSVETIEYIKSLEFEPWNTSLMLSKNHQVINLPELADLKSVILAAAEKYWREVICADYSTNLVARHSWISKHEPGDQNPPHEHTTSIFVVCEYLQAPDNCGDIIFVKDNNYLNLFPAVIDLDYHTRNMINSKKFSVTPKKDLAVFFPSHLNHTTEINTSDTTRYALNVDFWFEGTVRKNSNGFESVF
jgi:uncharacterized protein (TIGR02466 family)